MWVMDALKSSGTNMLRQGPLFKEIKMLMHHFNKSEARHVGREANTIAYKLARHARYADDMVVWWHSTPYLIK